VPWSLPLQNKAVAASWWSQPDRGDDAALRELLKRPTWDRPARQVVQSITWVEFQLGGQTISPTTNSQSGGDGSVGSSFNTNKPVHQHRIAGLARVPSAVPGVSPNAANPDADFVRPITTS